MTRLHPSDQRAQARYPAEAVRALCTGPGRTPPPPPHHGGSPDRCRLDPGPRCADPSRTATPQPTLAGTGEGSPAPTPLSGLPRQRSGPSPGTRSRHRRARSRDRRPRSNARPQCRWPTCAGRWMTPACRSRSAEPCSLTGAPTGGVHASQPVAGGWLGAAQRGIELSTCGDPCAHVLAVSHRSGHTVSTYSQCNTYKPVTRQYAAVQNKWIVHNRRQPIVTREYTQVTGSFFPLDPAGGDRGPSRSLSPGSRPRIEGDAVWIPDGRV